MPSAPIIEPEFATAPTRAPQPVVELQGIVAPTPEIANSDALEFHETHFVDAPSAHRAVEVVLTTVDRVASREQRAVDLQFTVGGEDLSVRVELRADEVHATFRTDSPELRAALAHEWQTVSIPSERGQRIAPPVFTTSDANSYASGDGASQQRDSRARQSAAEAERAASGRIRGTTPAVGPAAATTGAARSTSRTSRHLHTLA